MGFPLGLLYVVLTLLSPGDLIPEIAPYRPMVVLLLAALLLSLATLLQQPRMLRAWQCLFLIGLFAAICASRAINGWMGGAVAAFTSFAVHVVTFFLILLSCNSARKVKIIAIAMVLVSMYYTTRGIMAVNLGIETQKYTTEDRTAIDPETGQLGAPLLRTVGLGYLNDPNDLCQLYLISMSMLWTMLRKQNVIFNLLFILLPTAYLLFGLYQTGSRGGLVGLLVLFAVVLYRRVGVLGPVISVGLATAFVLALGFGGTRIISATAGTGGSRLELWSNALGVFRGHPWFGVGYDWILDYMETYKTVHNSWLLSLAELGVVGGFFWMGLLTISYLQMRSLEKFKDPAPEQEVLVKLGRGLYAALLSWMATAWFLSRTYTISLYILLALITAVWIQSREVIPNLKPMRLIRITQYTMLMMAGSILAVWVSVRLRWAG